MRTCLATSWSAECGGAAASWPWPVNLVGWASRTDASGAPTSEDIEAVTGVSAATMLGETPVGDGNNVWCVAGRVDVEANVRSTGYPFDQFTFVEGDVAQTLHASAPEQVSLLRLDTDWYESTKVGLEVLYPRLVVGGVCILDDYGHWQGARKAVDDYFEQKGHRPFMHSIDFSGRVFIKTR